MGEISCISAEISAPQFPPNPQLIRELHGIVLDSQLIDLLGLYILFSQYRSCDNTQEAWSFVLFIKKSAYALILMNKTKDQTSWVLSHDLYWENKMYKPKRSIENC